MQIFPPQTAELHASWIELGSCSWLFGIVRFPCLLLLSGWLLAGSELPDEGILHRAIEPLDRPSSLAAGQLGACFWIAAVCIFSPLTRLLVVASGASSCL
jgi:hypothetical protein